MSVKSMTGFGAARVQVGTSGEAYRIELKSVNHRHLDLRPRLPRDLSALEPRLRQQVSEHVRRGHVDIVLAREGGDEAPVEVRVDTALAARARAALEEVRAAAGIEEPVGLSHLLAFDGVVTTIPSAIDLDEIWRALSPGIAEAVRELDAMRSAEGERLGRDLAGRTAAVREIARAVESALPRVLESARQRAAERLAEIAARVEAEWRADRLEAEMALLADRSDVTEELVRLRSHLTAFDDLLGATAGEPVGRKLEFLAIELNRELNTIASKSSDAGIGQLIVDAKAEVERIREQVANVE